MAFTVFGASCVTELATTTDESELAAGPSSLDRPVAQPGELPPIRGGALPQAPIPGARLVGFYDMFLGAGQLYQIAPISAAGGSAINIDDPSLAAITNLNVLWVHNQDNAGFGGEYVARLPEITAAVNAGMVLVLHDRAVSNAQTILPGAGAFSFVRNFDQQFDINIRDGSTSVTTGLNDASLDNGNSSNHGFVAEAGLPARARRILSSTSPDRVVTLCYPVGRGAVIYSTIPLDFYLQGFFPGPLADNMNNIYAPNVVKFAMDGACTLRGPRPTPNAI